MTTIQPTLVPVIVEPDFDSVAVSQAIAGFLAGYGDTTRDGLRRQHRVLAGRVRSAQSSRPPVDNRSAGEEETTRWRSFASSFAAMGVASDPPLSAYWTTVGIGVLVTVAALVGLSNPDVVYPTAELREFALANDIVSLAIGVPLLIASMWLAGRGRMAGRLAWPGVLLYLLYGAVAYVVALPVTWVYPIHLVVASGSVYMLIGLAVRLDAAAIKKKLVGQIPERWSAGVLIALGGFSLVRAVVVLGDGIAGGSGLERTELAVLVADVLISPAWIVGGLLLWRRTPYGLVGALALLLQACMLFVGLLAVLALQPWITGTEFAPLDLLVVAAMGLVCFIPFVAVVRQTLRSDGKEAAGTSLAS